MYCNIAHFATWRIRLIDLCEAAMHPLTTYYVPREYYTFMLLQQHA